MRYAVVIEQAIGNYSAYVPDLPGCIATGQTLSEVKSARRLRFIWREWSKTACLYHSHQVKLSTLKLPHNEGIPSDRYAVR
jgi:hypothetical protein